MSDELKDFRYYADKSEWLLSSKQFDGKPLNHQTVMVEMAKVYAELAKAAPKTEPKMPYDCSNNWRHGEYTYVCQLRYDHDGRHRNDAAGFVEWDWHKGTSMSDAREDND